ncbi:uncharacterized protein [Spinacia oleracea]|uniref:Uncharacterized protein isoform X4 n=1 Tax=Spinacia oleracea TaxID=3562 RepID=A0ABM3QSP3_SPIOL|nr:uncharacterized protein LOC110798178 isoform X4 [Spinacia oleracea]
MGRTKKSDEPKASAESDEIPLKDFVKRKNKEISKPEEENPEAKMLSIEEQRKQILDQKQMLLNIQKQLKEQEDRLNAQTNASKDENEDEHPKPQPKKRKLTFRSSAQEDDAQKVDEQPETKKKGTRVKTIPNRNRTRLQLYKEEFPQTMKEVNEEFEALEKKKSAPVNKKRKGTSKKGKEIVLREDYEKDEEEVEEESISSSTFFIKKRGNDIMIADGEMEVKEEEKPVIDPKQKPHEHKLNVRQTAQMLMRFLKGISSDKPINRAKQQAITELGFGSFLNLDIPPNVNPFPYELLSHFNSSTRALDLQKSSLHITIGDIYLVYGIPIGGDQVIELTDETDPAVKKVFSDFWKYWDVQSGCPKLVKMIEKLIKETTKVDDNWKRSFLVVVVNTMIKSTTNISPNFKFLASTVNLNRVRNLNWCHYAYTSLLTAAKYWNEDRSRWFAGPLPFLMVCYFDRVQIEKEYPPRSFPIIKCWSRQMISSRVKHDNECGFGHGIILDRIESPPELIQYRRDILLEKEQEEPPQPQQEEQEQEQPQPPPPQHEEQEQEQPQPPPTEQEEVPPPLQQKQQQQQQKQQQAHQSSPVTELGEDQEIPEQQTHSNPEEVKLPSTVEEFHQEFLKTTAELSGVMNKFNNLLSLSKKFFDTTVDVKETMSFNMAEMWSKCSETQLPTVFDNVKNASNEERKDSQEMGSILIQDKEFFSSDYFSILFDDAVKKATRGKKKETVMEKETEEPMSEEPLSEESLPELPPFLTPPTMDSENDGVNDLTLKLGLPSISDITPTHDYEEEMRIQALLMNNSLTEGDLQTISGEKEDYSEKEQQSPPKTDSEKGTPIPNREEQDFETPKVPVADSQGNVITPSVYLRDEEDVPTKTTKDEEDVPTTSQIPATMKRIKNVPIVLRSPFLTQYSHLLEASDKLSQEDKDLKCILDYAIAEGDPSELVYYDKWNLITRANMQTLGGDVWVENNIIDTFAKLLNDDRDQCVKSNMKFYFSTIPYNMLLQNDAYGGTQDSQGTEQKRFQNFVDSIKHEMSVANVSSLNGYHLLFFPVCSGAHFFLIVINNKTKKVEILDNLDLPEGIPFENKYEQNPQNTFETWLKFCELEGYPLKNTQIKQYEITLPSMPWKNRENKVECGVYAMRHMETYKGNPNWDCGFTNYEDDKIYIRQLRIHYATQILSSAQNEKHELRYLALKQANQVE